MIFATLSLLLLALASVKATPPQQEVLFVQDLLEHQNVNHTWMEIGYATLTDTEWTTITTTVHNLNPNNDREMSVFLSLPEYGGPTKSDGWPMVVKMNGRAERIASGAYRFQALLVQPNDTYCPKIWWTPKNSPPISVGWLIVEEGAYNVSTSMLIFGSGEITRDNSEPMLSYDTPHLYHHKYVMNYTTGCDIDDPEAVCEFAEKESTVSYSNKRWSHLGASNQIQTSINKVPGEPNKELWMNTRVRHVFPDRIVMMLAVHSVYVNYDNPSNLFGPYNYNFTIYPDYADIHTPEIASYFVWEKHMRLKCLEGLVMETEIEYPITHEALRMDYFFEYDEVPGLFGMIGTLNSVGDTTSLRVFNRTLKGSYYITQEDQCTDEEETHTTKESAFSMVVGKAKDVIGDTQCFIAYDVKGCTYNIYLYDLFMDGWDNVELVVDTGDDVFKFTTSCGNKVVTFYSLTCTWNAYMQTSDGQQPITWWENYWGYEHVGYNDETFYIGDYDSTISVVRETVTFTDLVNTRVDAKENKCEQCKVAPPPPGPNGPNMGDGKDGNGNGDGNGNAANGGVAGLTAGNVAPAPPAGVGIAPGDAGAPYGTLQITGVSAPIDSSAPVGARAFTVVYALNVVGLTSPVDSVGFYRGFTGENGPSFHMIDVSGHTTAFYVEGSFVVSEEDITRWINGGVYIQVNTANHMTGEIRAQAVLPYEWVQYFIDYYEGSGMPSQGNDDKTGKDGDAKKDNKGSAPPAPVPVVIELFDDGGIGWYNHSGKWSYPMKAVGDERRRLHPPHVELPQKPTFVLDYSVPQFPDILMYPTYVIMNKEKTKQLHVGSLCPHREIERCEERLPPRGEFVFRVMGKDLEDDAHWKFCGIKGYVGQEMQFEMKKGKCVAVSVTNAYTLCSLNSVLTVEGGLVLTGLSVDFTETDSKVLENEIASMLVSTSKLVINSWHVNAEGNMEVSFEATIVAEKHGVDGSIRSNVDTLVSNLLVNMQSALSSGAFMASLSSALSEFPQSQVTITKATSVTLTSFQLVDITYIEASTEIDDRSPSSLPYPSSQSKENKDVTSEEQNTSFIVTSCAIVGVVVAIAAFALRTRQQQEFIHKELAIDSEHADTIPEFDLGLEVTSAPKGFFSSKERF